MLESRPLLDPSPPQQQRVELPFIQGLRFVAMSWIVAYHFAATPTGSLESNMVHHRPLDLFTVISGFATQLAYGSKPDLGGQARFVARRLARVGIVYYVSLSFAFVLRLYGVGMVAATTFDSGRELVSFALGLLGLNVWVCPFVNMATLPSFPRSEADIPVGSDLDFLADQCYPHNGPLWYVQAIVFCWATYPAFHRRLRDARHTTTSSLYAMVGLWCIANLPALVTALTRENDRLWDFTHVLPVFLLAPFYLGVACCELYQCLSANVPIVDSDGKAGGLCGTASHRWATLAAESILVLFCGLTLVPFPNTFFHAWSLVFGLILSLFGVCAAERGRQYSIGICWLLESRVAVALGDVSLVAFAFQFPVGKLLFSVLRPTETQPWHPCTSDWMRPAEFVPFLLGLFGLSMLFRKFVDVPLSMGLRERLETALAPVISDTAYANAALAPSVVAPT